MNIFLPFTHTSGKLFAASVTVQPPVSSKVAKLQPTPYSVGNPYRRIYKDEDRLVMKYFGRYYTVYLTEEEQ